MTKYDYLILWVFKKHYVAGDHVVRFNRSDFTVAARQLGVSLPKNIGDIPYTYRYRRPLPKAVSDCAPAGADWIITSTGQSTYEFRLASPAKIEPSRTLKPIPIPDATPEIVEAYAPGRDEQALLTRARYNRLVGIFTGLTCYSIQNHLRTTVPGVGQIEVDEVYVGLDTRGVQYVLPCQAKSPGDKFGIVQVMQDMALCKHRYPQAICRPIALQFAPGSAVSVLELDVARENGLLRLQVVEERRYRLLPFKDV